METYLINQINSDEITKDAKSDSAKSLTDLSIVELRNGNYDKALSFSEEIIRSDSSIPAGWLLKAIAEANLIEFENNYFDSSINAMSKAEEYSKGIKSVKGVLKTIFLATVVRQYSDIIKTNIETSIQLEQQAEEEEKKAKTSAAIAAIGAGVALSSNKSLGKVLGGAAAVGGASSAISKQKSASEFKQIAGGVYGLALSGIKLTSPIVLALINEIKSIKTELKEYVTHSIEEWKSIAILLYNKELDTICKFLDEKRKKLTVDEKEFRKFVKESADFVELKQLLFLGDMIGLDEHNSIKIAESLDRELNETFGDISEEKLNEYFSSKKMTKILGIGLMVAPLIIFAAMGSSGEEPSPAFTGLFWVGAILTWWATKKQKAEIQKTLDEKFLKYKNDLSGIKVTIGEIDVKLLGA